MSSLTGLKRADGQRVTLRMGALLGGSTVLLNLAARHPTRFMNRVLDGSFAVVGGARPEGVTCRSVTVAGRLPAHLYAPPGGSDRLLVYFHGGGYCLGSLATHGGTAAALAGEAGCQVLLVDYRLAPAHRYPAALEDSLAAYRWAVAEQAYEQIVVGGDSAGGQLAGAVCLGLEPGEPQPAGALLIYPVTDADVNAYPSAWRFERGPLLSRRTINTMLDHYAAGARVTLLGAAGLDRLPPTYLCTAGMDPLRDQGEAFAAQLRDAGVDISFHRFTNLPHGFIGLLTDPTARRAVSEVAVALRRLLGSPSQGARRRADPVAGRSDDGASA